MSGSEADQNLHRLEFDFEALDACPTCGCAAMVPNGRVEWLDVQFWYVVCPECGLKYMNPRPTLDSYREFYTKMFWQQKIRNIGFKQSGQTWSGGKSVFAEDGEWAPDLGRKNVIERAQTVRPRDVIPALRSAVSLESSTRVLEVGAAYGVTLRKLMEEFGCRAFAIEPSADAEPVLAEAGIEKVGNYAEDLETLAGADPFDAIVFSHVLENTVRPVDVLRYAKRCLAAGGAVYVQTPNMITFDQMNPYHPYVFAPGSLRRLASVAGLGYEQLSNPIDRMLTVLLR